MLTTVLQFNSISDDVSHVIKIESNKKNTFNLLEAYVNLIEHLPNALRWICTRLDDARSQVPCSSESIRKCLAFSPETIGNQLSSLCDTFVSLIDDLVSQPAIRQGFYHFPGEWFECHVKFMTPVSPATEWKLITLKFSFDGVVEPLSEIDSRGQAH